MEIWELLFQIQDDLIRRLDGDPDKFGKRVGGDIISHKKTYLLLTALEKQTISKNWILKLYPLSAKFLLKSRRLQKP